MYAPRVSNNPAYISQAGTRREVERTAVGSKARAVWSPTQEDKFTLFSATPS